MLERDDTCVAGYQAQLRIFGNRGLPPVFRERHMGLTKVMLLEHPEVVVSFAFGSLESWFIFPSAHLHGVQRRDGSHKSTRLGLKVPEGRRQLGVFLV